MKKLILIFAALLMSSFVFAETKYRSLSKDRAIISYTLEYFSKGKCNELEFYITDSSVETETFEKKVLDAQKSTAGKIRLKEALAEDFKYRFRIDLYGSKAPKKTYYVKNGFAVYDCKNKVLLELEDVVKRVYAEFCTYAVENLYKEDVLCTNKSGSRRVCFYLDSRPFIEESSGLCCDRGNILFFDCNLGNAPKVVKQVRNAQKIPNGFAVKEILLEGEYIMAIYKGDKVEKTYKIVNSKNAYDDSENLRKVSVTDDLLVMAVEFMISSWI